jgi:hypothetical protein
MVLDIARDGAVMPRVLDIAGDVVIVAVLDIAPSADGADGDGQNRK